MGKFSKQRVWLTGLILFFAIQCLHTATNAVHWPINPTNLFFSRCDYQRTSFTVILTDQSGTKTAVDPRHCLPVETFRLKGLFKEIYVYGEDPMKKAEFSQLMLDSLNRGGWIGFDEIYPPATPTPGQQYVALEVQLGHYDLTQYPPNSTPIPTKTECIYSHKTTLLKG